MAHRRPSLPPAVVDLSGLGPLTAGVVRDLWSAHEADPSWALLVESLAPAVHVASVARGTSTVYVPEQREPALPIPLVPSLHRLGDLPCPAR